MTALEIIGGILLILASVILIVSILLQEGGKGGLGALGGESESFMGKNGDRSKSATLVRITKICSAVFVLASLALYIITAVVD